MKIFRIKNYLPHPTSPYKGEGKKKGFGLLEVLISAVIIIMILAALVFIGRAALSNNEYLNERAQAIYLAQEGLEITRQIRDTNWIDGVNDTEWNSLRQTSGLGGPHVPITASGDYVVFYNTPDARLLLVGLPTAVIPIAGAPFTVNGVTYTQKITVAPVDPAGVLIPNGAGTNLRPYALKITSTISWNFSGQSKSVSVSEIITNWRPDF